MSNEAFEAQKGKGRRKGSKHKLDPTLKASVKAIYKELSQTKPELFKEAIENGIKAKPPYSFQYLQLGAHYLDGKPKDMVEFDAAVEFSWKTSEDETV